MIIFKNNQQTILVNENDQIQVEKTVDYHSKITFGKQTSDYFFQIFSDEHFVGLEYHETKALSQLTGDYKFYQSLCQQQVSDFILELEFLRLKMQYRIICRQICVLRL